MEVLLGNRQKKVKLNLKRIRTIAEEIMKFEGIPDNSELSVVLCDDDFIQKLNHEYLGKNRPTDVLSFPMEDEDFEAEVHLIGDVVINLETAERQARKHSHSIGLEVAFLLIHGILHLLGYDHAKSRLENARMKEREVSICGHLNEKKLLKGLDKASGSSLISRKTPSKKKVS